MHGCVNMHATCMDDAHAHHNSTMQGTTQLHLQVDNHDEEDDIMMIE